MFYRSASGVRARTFALRDICVVLALIVVAALLAPRPALAARHHHASAASAATSGSRAASKTDEMQGPYAEACVMEPVTGTVVFDANAHKPWPTASLAKMMLMLIVNQKLHDGSLKLTDQVTSSRLASKMGGSQVYLKEGEVFSLDDDRVCIAIGDVVGHSLEAAAVMAQLRTGVRSYMLDGYGPTAVLDRLNRLLLRFHIDITATVCCAIYERSTHRCELANAGHPAPLIRSTASATYLPDGGPLLGIDLPAGEACVFTLASGDVLLLFTDGLVERRSETIEVGLERLTSIMPPPETNLEVLCDTVLRAAGPASMTDDIAIVAMRPH